jgi:hypothetical protein
MTQEPPLQIQNLRDTQQLISDIDTLIYEVKLLRIRIALSLLLREVRPLGVTSLENP